MQMRTLLLCFLVCVSMLAASQESGVLSGRVTDKHQTGLPGATLILNKGEYKTISNAQGKYQLSGISKGNYQLIVSYVGYKTVIDTVAVEKQTTVNFQLTEEIQTLQEVVVIDRSDEQTKRQHSLSVEIVNTDYLKQNQGGSLAASLERLPGISTIGIGSSQAKPVIRGLSFNRIVVAEEGIAHEAQQWGADHGLEIDQYAVEKVELIKGPSSLMYGSGAIGGVLNVQHNTIPARHTIGGTVNVSGKTVNNYLGTSLSAFARREKWFVSLRSTLINYADYRVPVSSIDIYSYKAPLHENQLRNTAGNEYDFHLSTGYVQDHYIGKLYASNVHSKSGMFANAHGLEPRYVDTLLHDKSARDIHFPYQQVNHVKVMSINEWKGARYKLEIKLGAQHNLRQEWSDYTGSHYYFPPVFPDTLDFSAELERQFDKYVYTANTKLSWKASDDWIITYGLNGSFQKNNIDGRGFIIPAFNQQDVGGFVHTKFTFSAQQSLQLGVRYDYSQFYTDAYSDWFLSPVEIRGNDTVWGKKQRAVTMSKTFGDVSWSLGYSRNTSHWVLKANLGKSYRMPSPKEIAANGINYHYFRFEIGNARLNPESSYQIDLGAEYHSKQFALGISPFVNYFSNYIYLNPTPEMPQGYQVYKYSQSEVFRCGGEIHGHYQVWKGLQLGLVGEYVYAIQLSGEKEAYPLPFMPPASLLLNAKYLLTPIKVLDNSYVSIDYKLTAAQNNVLPPEEHTPGYQLVNLGLGGDLLFGKQTIKVALQVQNLFHTKYYNHTSFYRLINVPGPGRNVVLNVTFPFSGKGLNSFKRN